jgi:anti-sigma B factor antagonist
MPELEIAERDVSGVIVLTLAGRLVLDDGEALLRKRIDALVNLGRIEFVLNLHDITFVDSCGIGALVSKFVTLKRRGGHLKLVCPSLRCRHVLEITHLLPLFEVFETDEAAIGSFRVVTH